MESQITTNFWGQDSDKAFRYLYDKYASTLRYFSAKYVDDDATIEDVVQDAFLNLWEKRNEFKTESTIKAYLYKIVRSFSVDTIRRRNIANRYAEKIVLEKEDQEFFIGYFNKHREKAQEQCQSLYAGKIETRSFHTFIHLN